MQRFERFARYAVVSASALFFLVFGVLPYRGIIMSTMDMAMTTHGDMVHTMDTTMPVDCLSLCISANQEYVDGVIQAFYVFFSTMSPLLAVVFFIVALYRLPRVYVASTSLVRTMNLYLRRQSCHLQLFSPIHELYRTGILAPKLCA